MKTEQGVGTGAGTGLGVRTGTGQGGITFVLQTQFSSLKVNGYTYIVMFGSVYHWGQL